MLTTVIKTHKGIKAISVSCFVNFLVVSSYKIDLLICVCMCLNLQLTYITAGDIGDIKDHDKAGEDGVTLRNSPVSSGASPLPRSGIQSETSTRFCVSLNTVPLLLSEKEGFQGRIRQ